VDDTGLEPVTPCTSRNAVILTQVRCLGQMLAPLRIAGTNSVEAVSFLRSYSNF